MEQATIYGKDCDLLIGRAHEPTRFLSWTHSSVCHLMNVKCVGKSPRVVVLTGYHSVFHELFLDPAGLRMLAPFSGLWLLRLFDPNASWKSGLLF